MKKRLEELEEQLKGVLKKNRFIHTQGVRYTAAALAMKYGASVEQAQVAGVLHDCAKSYSDEELLEVCNEHEIEISASEKASPHLLHAKVGAYFAKEIYGVEDKDILDGIRYHTTGRKNMTVLEQIIFIADYIEPNRKEIPGLDESRRLAFCDLDMATYYILKNTLSYLKEIKGEEMIDGTTREAYLYYKEKCKEKELCQQN